MKRQNTYVILLLLPIAAIVSFATLNTFDSRKNELRPRGSQIGANTSSSHPGDKESEIGSRNNGALLLSIKESEDERTKMRYDLADRESRRDIEHYPNQEEFLLNKHRDEFDTWGLSASDRAKVVKSVDHYTQQVGIAFRDSNRSWPIEVGHAANTDANRKHALALQQGINALKAKLFGELKASVGERFAEQFMKTHYPPIGESNPRPTLVD